MIYIVVACLVLGYISAGDAACTNSDSRCSQWVPNGFCNSNFYTCEQKRSYCALSCNIGSCSPRLTCAVAPPPPPSGGSCTDADNRCATWKTNGFCSSTFYTCEQKRQHCGATCGVCSCSGGGTTCTDANAQCSAMKTDGFCDTSDYTCSNKKKLCAKTCDIGSCDASGANKVTKCDGTPAAPTKPGQCDAAKTPKPCTDATKCYPNPCGTDKCTCVDDKPCCAGSGGNSPKMCAKDAKVETDKSKCPKTCGLSSGAPTCAAGTVCACTDGGDATKEAACCIPATCPKDATDLINDPAKCTTCASTTCGTSGTCNCQTGKNNEMCCAAGGAGNAPPQCPATGTVETDKTKCPKTCGLANGAPTCGAGTVCACTDAGDAAKEAACCIPDVCPTGATDLEPDTTKCTECTKTTCGATNKCNCQTTKNNALCCKAP